MTRIVSQIFHFVSTNQSILQVGIVLQTNVLVHLLYYSLPFHCRSLKMVDLFFLLKLISVDIVFVVILE